MELTFGVILGVGLVVFAYYLYSSRNAKLAAKETKEFLVGLADLLAEVKAFSKEMDEKIKKEEEMAEKDAETVIIVAEVEDKGNLH